MFISKFENKADWGIYCQQKNVTLCIYMGKLTNKVLTSFEFTDR